MSLYRRLSRPAAFAIALIGAPMIVAAVGGALSLIGDVEPSGLIGGLSFFLLFSVPFGALSYLIVGGYFFWRTAAKGQKRSLDFLIAGFVANFVAAGLAAPLAAVIAAVVDIDMEPGQAATLVLFVHAFGLLFAPLYGFLFGMIYTRLSRDLSEESGLPEDVEAVFR